MHISDGILPTGVTIATLAVSGGISTILAVKMKQQKIPRIAVITAVLFVSSLLHVKLGPTSIHPVLTGIGVILLGPDIFLSALVALLFQAVLFQHGGLTALGANTLIIGGSALLMSLWIVPLTLKIDKSAARMILFFLAGFLSVLTAGGGNYLILTLSYQEFQPIARLFLLSVIPLAIFEGVICALILQFVYKVKPDLITNR
jgi:cobalt/nickel transport system permease protein